MTAPASGNAHTTTAACALRFSNGGSVGGSVGGGVGGRCVMGVGGGVRGTQHIDYQATERSPGT